MCVIEENESAQTTQLTESIGNRCRNGTLPRSSETVIPQLQNILLARWISRPVYDFAKDILPSRWVTRRTPRCIQFSGCELELGLFSD
jgi:hypothetical protein